MQPANAVRKSIHVAVAPEKAFRVFTEGFDSWWPRTHHIGKSPMTKALIEGKVGGRCYSMQADGTECDWGQVLVWEPPTRLVFSWQITHQWGYEPDLAKSSEVEVLFQADAGGTSVTLEHRGFEKMGEAGAAMSQIVDSPGGWGMLLQLFATVADKPTDKA